MSKLVSFLFIINFGVVFFNFHSIYRNERRLFSSFIRFSNTKMGTTMLNSLILLFLYSMCDFGILLFFGGLRPFETDRIKERIWFAVTDTFLAFAVFSSDISSNLLLSLALLLFIKYFHFAFEVRIGSIERDVVIPKSTILKSSVFFIFFLFMDLFFVHYLYVYSDNSDNIQHLMINEYAILCINLVYNMVKLIIHYIDYIKDYAFHAKITLFSYLFIFKCIPFF
uniref:E3 ubiquitin-protein ligase hrd-1 (Trinotate prediction) n=1 Tax=Henneguya salminicola TaxID=69463 RepID=A0A6G3MFK6_HENSL